MIKSKVLICLFAAGLILACGHREDTTSTNTDSVHVIPEKVIDSVVTESTVTYTTDSLNQH